MVKCKLHRYVFQKGEGKGVYIFRCHECGDIKQMKLVPDIEPSPIVEAQAQGHIDLESGARLYWKTSPCHGGRLYYSDEIADGVIVYDTGIIDIKTIIKAIELGKSI